MLVQELFQAKLSETPNRIFIRYEERDFTFEEVWSEIEKVAAKLKSAGLRALDRVLVCEWNNPRFVFFYFGVLLAGGVVVTVSPLLTWEELSKIHQLSGSRLWLGQSGLEFEDFFIYELKLDPVSEDLCDPRCDLQVIIYTSGTTADPKGVMLTEQNIRAQIWLASQAIDLRSEDRLLSTLSLSHVFGQMDLLWLSLYKGCSLRLMPHFEAREVLRFLLLDQITILIAVPTMYRLLIRGLAEKQSAFPALRLCHTGAAPLTSDLFWKIKDAFGLIPQQGYGLTETCSMAFSNPLLGACKDRSVGLPLPGVELLILSESGESLGAGEIGEVVLRGEIISPGYLGNPEATSQAGLDQGFLKTGDLGYRDEENYLFLVDRVKDMINHSGFKVYPSEVEEIIRAHPAVREVVVIGIDSELRGQKIKAILELEAEYYHQKAQVTESLRRLCDHKLARYKRPHQFEIISEIPKTPSGKLLRRKFDR
ncbi:MAG: AMP-binding protein [Candidatus Caenarcaniphilales bacterium]|nr:AMP-binding protein [Candidatus Caenarcaniphilales bacterium]